MNSITDCSTRRKSTCRHINLIASALILFIPVVITIGQESANPAKPPTPLIVGLFIGIDGYPRLDQRYHLHSCVDDAKAMQAFFTNQFQVSEHTLLTEQGATRKGIGQALRDLVRQVSEARKHFAAMPPGDRRPINVIITYSGHGVRVKRLKSELNPEELDDAWMCYDSTIHCDQIVRGYELLEIHRQLSLAGASVVIVSDSCHSGSNYRGFEVLPAEA